ncbi:hypothetical protein SAMN02745116_02350, partial [Pilibacter termitis]
MDKCTRELLGFQDESLIFEKDRWFSRGVDKKNRKFNRIDGLYAKVPTHCESCGVLFQSSADYYKHGTIANKRVIQVPE